MNQLFFFLQNVFNQFKKSKVFPYVLISLCALFVIYKYTLQVSTSVMTKTLIQEFHMSGVELGHLNSSFFYSLLITQIFAGYCFDRYEPKGLILGAVGICSVGAVLFSISKTVALLTVARALMGMGGALTAIGYFKVASSLFSADQFPLISGLFPTAVMLGVVVGQLFLAYLIEYFHWRLIILMCGLSGILLALLIYLSFRNVNLNYKPLKKNNLSSHSVDPLEWSEVMALFKEKHNWLLALCNGFAFVPLHVLSGVWGIPFLKLALNINQPSAAFLSSCAFIGLGIGGPCLGWLSNYYRQKKSIMLFSAMNTLFSISLILYIPNLSFFTMAGLLFSAGFSTSALMLGFVLAKELNSPRIESTVMTVLNTGGVIIPALTEPLIGQVLDWSCRGENMQEICYFSLHHYQTALLILPVCLLVEILLLMFIQDTRSFSKN